MGSRQHVQRLCLFLLAWVVLISGGPLLAEQKAKSRAPLLTLEREVKEGGDWLAFNAKGTELLVCDGTTVKILDARTFKRLKRYQAAGRQAVFALGDNFLVVGGVLSSCIELLDRKT